MSLATELAEALDAPKVKPPCKVGVWLAVQSDEARANFDTLLERGGIPTHMHRICVRNGLEASQTTFKNHCRRVCACYEGVPA